MDNAEGDVDETYLDIAICTFGGSKYQKALDILLLGYLKNNENQNNFIGNSIFVTNNWTKKKKLFIHTEKILNINPYSNEAWFNLGQVYFSQDNFPKTIEAYNFATTIDEDDAISLATESSFLLSK